MISFKSRIANRAPILAAIAPIVFTATWLMLGVLSPGYTLWGTQISPYSATSQPISGLGLGVTGPYMNAAFIGCGALLFVGICGAIGGIPEMSRRARILNAAVLASTPIGMMLCGVFTLESMMLHSTGFALAAIVPIAGFVVCGLTLRTLPRWRSAGSLLTLAGPITLALVVWFFTNFDPTGAGANTGISGLIQRVLVTQVLAWFVFLGYRSYAQARVV